MSTKTTANKRKLTMFEQKNKKQPSTNAKQTMDMIFFVTRTTERTRRRVTELAGPGRPKEER